MQRLLALTLLLATALTPLHAQQQVHQFTIGGDVNAPQTYQYSGQQPVHVRDLLTKAESSSAMGNALILRGPELSLVAVDQIAPNHPYQGLPLTNGDVVIFRSANSDPPAKNSGRYAFIYINSIPDLLPLDSSGVSVKTLLNGVNFPRSIQIRVTHTQLDPPTTEVLNAEYEIQHGDFVQLAEAIAAAGLSAANLNLAYALPPANGAMAMAANLSSTDSDNQSSALVATDAIDQVVLSIPSGPKSQGVKVTETPATDSMAQDDHPNDQWSSNGQMELRPANSEIAPVAESSARNSEATLIHPASLRSAANNELIGKLPSRTSPVVSEAGGGAIWNVVFIGGLLFAMGLIVIGWLKTQQEREMEAQIDNSLRNSLATTSHSGNESKAAEVDDDCPVLSAGLQNGVSERQGETVVSDEFDNEEANAHAEADQLVFRNDQPKTVTGDVWFDDVLKDEKPAAAKTNPATEEESFSDTDTEIEVADSAHPAASTNEGGWSDLEDLVQNRLPMELTEIQLPLRVNLFGRPAGPKRLRIDAAHTEIAAPNIMKKGRRSRKSQPAGAEKAKAPSGDKTNSPKPDDDFSGLDKALNYLEEQSGS